MTKILVVLTAVLSIAISCLFIATAAQWDNWRQLARDYQSQRDAAITLQQAEQASSQALLALKDQALGAREGDLKAAQRQIDDLNEKLARARSDATQSQNEKLAAEAGRTKLQELLDVQTGELKAYQKQNETLLAQNMDLQSRNARTNSRVLELTTNVSILTDQVRNLQDRLVSAQEGQGLARSSSGTLSAAPAPRGAVPVNAPPVRGEIRGQVVEVNGPYASINVGESSGVTAGMTFMIHRADGSYVGELTVESVRPKEAGGRVTAGADVRAGDLVVSGLD